MLFKRILIALIFLQCMFSNSQSLRGLSVLNDSQVWVSGSRGFVGKYDKDSFDLCVLSREYLHKDFRDIHGFTTNSAIIMSVADSGVLLKTWDGGKTWREVFRDNDSGVFFDVIEFDKNTNGKFGILLGDPLNSSPNYLYSKFTLDSGNHWMSFESGNWNKISPKLNSLYAASGSSARILNFLHDEINGLIHVTIIIGGGGDKGASLRMANIIWNSKGQLLSEKVTNLPLPMSEEPGWGVYGLSEPINGQIAVAGGHWKFPDGRPSGPSSATTNFKECDNGLFWLTYNTDNALTIKPMRVCNYLSGAILVHNKFIVAVGSKGINHVKLPRKKNDLDGELKWELPNGKIQDFIIQSQNRILPIGSNTRVSFPFKGLNAIAVSESYVWIVGVAETPKIIRIPLNLWK